MRNPDPNPEFSLVISTIGPATGLAQCLTSLVTQSLDSLEVIVVDQNTEGHVRAITEGFIGSGKVRYTTSAVGLSKGRNAGFALARGRFVAFPDDDCAYPPNLLAQIKAKFAEFKDASGICVRCVDHLGRDSVGRPDRRAGLITKSNVWRRAVSVGIFLRADAMREVGGFDETIGLGSNSPFKSGEETDLLLMLIRRGRKLQYDPALNVFHPRGPRVITAKNISRSYDYGMGWGHLLRRHDYSLHQIAIHIAKPLLGALIAVSQGNLSLAHLRFQRAKGRYDGWKSSLPPSPGRANPTSVES